MIELATKDGKHSVTWGDTVLFESTDRKAALSRAAVLQEIADRRGKNASPADLLMLFPPTAPAPLVLTALSLKADLTREDVFHADSGTWTMTNVLVFQPGVALKRVGDKWVRFDFTDDDTVSLVEAFAVMGWTPPLKIGHNREQPMLDGAPAIGRTVAVRAAETQTKDGRSVLGLFADLERVPPSIRDAIRKGELYERSIEFFRDIPRPDGKGTLRMVLKAISLLGEDLPAVRGMPPLDVATPKLSAEQSSETLRMENPNVADPTKDPAPVTLSAADYERLKASDAEVAKLKATSETQAKQIESLAQANARLEMDRRIQSATALCAELRRDGRITPAQESSAIALLTVLDRENMQAVVTLSVGTDGKSVESKTSEYDAFSKFLKGLPRSAGAPGAPRSHSGSEPGTSVAAFAALSREEQYTEIAKLGSRYQAEQVNGKPKYATQMAAYEQARKDLQSGAVSYEEVK